VAAVAEEPLDGATAEPDGAPVVLAEPTVAVELGEANAAHEDSLLPAAGDSLPPAPEEAIEEASDETSDETFGAVAGERPSWMPAPASATPLLEPEPEPEPEPCEPEPEPEPLTDPFATDISL
jgi:hypothetical protein